MSSSVTTVRYDVASLGKVIAFLESQAGFKLKSKNQVIALCVDIVAQHIGNGIDEQQAIELAKARFGLAVAKPKLDMNNVAWSAAGQDSNIEKAAKRVERELMELQELMEMKEKELDNLT